MATLTKEYFDKALKEAFQTQDQKIERRFDAQDVKMQKMLDGLARDLKIFIKDQDEELARIVNKGFEHTIKQFEKLDVLERMARLEKIVYKIAEAINLKVA